MATSQTQAAAGASAPALGFTMRPAARPKVAPPVDLAVTVDMTRSTEAFKVGVPEAARLVFDGIGTITSEVTVYLQVHGDHDCGQREVLLTDGGTPAQALADLCAIRYEGGGDAEEHHLTAIERLAERVPWTPGARRVLVAFTTDDTKPAHSGRRAAAIGQALVDARVTFFLIGHSTPTMRELVTAAHGYFFEISNTPSIAEMKQIGAALGGSLSGSSPNPTATRPALPPKN